MTEARVKELEEVLDATISILKQPRRERDAQAAMCQELRTALEKACGYHEMGQEVSLEDHEYFKTTLAASQPKGKK